MSELTITPDQAKADLRNMFASTGKGSEDDRAAMQLLQTLDIVKSRTDDKSILRMLYLADDILPSQVIGVLREYISGSLTQEQILEYLDQVSRAYTVAFSEAGITPTQATARLIPQSQSRP